MYVVCGLSILNGLSNLASQLAGPQDIEVPDMGDPQLQEFMEQWMKMAGDAGPAAILFNIIAILRDAFLIFAFTRLQAMNMWGVALAGAIISVIPCIGSPCCVCGVPFGIWALVVLNDPAVRAAFR